MKEIRTILCPTDFSEGSDRALNEAVALAEQLQAEVQLLHVYEMPLYNVPIGVNATAGLPGGVMDVVESVKQAVGARLEALRGCVDGRGVSIHARMVEGRPASTIAEVAKEEGVGMIAMSTHGHTGLRHLLIGSVAEQVVRTAPCPVLTFPAVD